MNPYTKRKFLSLPEAAQHKKCAALLREAYISSSLCPLEYYNEIQGWMNLPALCSNCSEDVSNRYHGHLGKAGIKLTEPSLLPRIRQGDRSLSAAPSLNINTYLDNIRSAHNVGSILRTIEAFQLGPVYFSPKTPGPEHQQVRKTSMGSTDHLVYHCHTNIEQLARPLIALETSDDAAALNQFQFPPSCTLVVGNEEYGISKEILLNADAIVEIPLYGKKNSLNVANAFAIAAATISQQLRQKRQPCFNLK